jgi:membrane protease YdiL (CAAX protease family)
MLHRWAAKWGNIRAIIALCLFFSAGFLFPVFYIYVIALLIYVILYAKTRSLLVVIIFMALENIIGTSLEFVIYNIF